MHALHTRSHSTRDIRRDNRSLVLTLLRRHTLMSRVELARQAGLTEAAISRITRELVDAGLIEEKPVFPDGRRGRPMVNLALASNGLYALGVDIGANSQSLCLTNLTGETIIREDLDLLSFKTAGAALKYCCKKALKMVQSAKVPPQRLVGVGVGIGIPGAADHLNRNLLQSPTLGWENLPVADIFEAALSVPARVEGRPRAILFAEHTSGVAQQKDNVLLIHLGLGIGVAVMIDGHVLRGSRNSAGQIGHLQVDPAGVECVCGQRGCLDTMASGYAIVSNLGMTVAHAPADTARIENVRLLKHAEKMAHAQDPATITIFRSAGQSLGKALTQLAPVFDPQLVILAGGLTQIPGYIEGVRDTLALPPHISWECSTMTLEHAAVCLALDTFVFGPRLDLARFA